MRRKQDSAFQMYKFLLFLIIRLNFMQPGENWGGKNVCTTIFIRNEAHGEFLARVSPMQELAEWRDNLKAADSSLFF